ncbi:MAG: DUF47 family protein [Candidatus Omnitrophica bacterium]|nr:DUF47 family protein [Candidatus Omnitrophota bacterium]
MFFKFLPEDFNFFDLFDKQVDRAVEAAKTLKGIANTPGLLDEAVFKKIQIIEHQGDEASHGIMEQLNKSFITPFDREDIHALTKEIDDIIDTIDGLVSRIKIYKIKGGDKQLIRFVELIEESVWSVASAVRGLRSMKNSKSIREACIEVNRLENVGDALRDKVLGELFETATDPITLIKWKEIYEDAETVLDICEDVAHVVESILVKHA